MNKKYIVIFGFIIIVIGLCAYWVNNPNKNITNPVVQGVTTQTTPTAVDTSNWATYRDEKIGYEIKYPMNATISTSTEDIFICYDNYSSLSIEQSKEKNAVLGNECFLSISMYAQKVENFRSLTVENWLIENDTSIVKGRADDKNKGTLFLGESTYHIQDVLVNEQRGLFEEVALTTYFFHNSYLWRITTTQLPANPSSSWVANPYYRYFEQSVPVTEAIMNSFKFTK